MAKDIGYFFVYLLAIHTSTSSFEIVLSITCPFINWITYSFGVE
jgi:hypothetical protein